MAIFHLSVKTVGRSAGKSATAAAAYRACEKIECDREGMTHDYTRKRGLSTSPRKERNEAIKAAGRELGIVKDELKGFEEEAQREHWRKVREAEKVQLAAQEKATILEVAASVSANIKPSLKKPDEEPPLEVYLKTENAIDTLAIRNKNAEADAKQAAAEAQGKANELQKQGAAIAAVYHAMPKRPAFLGAKEWDSKRAELAAQHLKVQEAHKTAQTAVKAAQEVQIKAKAMVGRDFASQQVLTRIREQRPDWLQNYEEGRRQHEAIQLQERQAKALEREGERAASSSAERDR